MRFLIAGILIFMFMFVGACCVVSGDASRMEEEFLKTREKEEKEECGDSFKRSLK